MLHSFTYTLQKELLIDALSYEEHIEKRSWQYFIHFFELAEKDRVYSLLLVASFVNIIIPPSFKDDRINVIPYQETFLNCLVCLSSRVYWNQALLKSPVFVLDTLSS